MSKRSADLMSKITLDTMCFALFELKPIPYEHYMKLFGHVNASQISTQTTNFATDQDSQTESKRKSTMWTQWPPELTVTSMQSPSYYDDRMGCGLENENETQVLLFAPMNIDLSLRRMQKLNASSNVSANSHLTVNIERLSWFLQKSLATLALIFSSPNRPNTQQISHKTGFIRLNWKEQLRLQHRSVNAIYSNCGQPDIVYTVHGSADGQEWFIAKWNTTDPTNPLNILSSWSGIVCIEVDSNRPYIIYAGLIDG